MKETTLNTTRRTIGHERRDAQGAGNRRWRMTNPYTHCPDPGCDCVDCLQWNAYARGEASAGVALANVSGALCDSGVVVPAEEWRYGEAVREIVDQRDSLSRRLENETQESFDRGHRIAELTADLEAARAKLHDGYEISQRLEEAAARLDVLASLEREYEKGKLR